MPESIMKLRSSFSSELAANVVELAIEAGRKENMLPLTVVVLDAGGRLVAMRSEDGSGVLRFDIAMGKAFGALGMGMSSRLIRDRLKERPSFQASLGSAADGRFIPVPGGVLVADKQGYCVAAVGISGDTSEKDEYCAISAIHAIGFASEPESVDENWRKSSLSGSSH